MRDTTDKQTELSVEQMIKKEWITPEMTELNLNKVLNSTETGIAGPSKS